MAMNNEIQAMEIIIKTITDLHTQNTILRDMINKCHSILNSNAQSSEPVDSHKELIKFIAKHKINPDHLKKFTIKSAIERGDLEMVELLLKNGANLKKTELSKP